jgi:hypothetical protein
MKIAKESKYTYLCKPMELLVYRTSLCSSVSVSSIDKSSKVGAVVLEFGAGCLFPEENDL